MATILVVTLLAGIAIGVPVAAALGLASTFALLHEGGLPLSLLAQRIYVGLDSFPLLAAPLFILAGGIMERGGISVRIINLAQSLVGHIRGGLGMVVIVGAMIFSGISGSHTADAAAIGSVMIPSMVRRGYSREFATAVVAASGGMGILIPPSLIIIFYGLLTNTSIAALFLAGLLPGLLTGAVGFVTTYIVARRQNLPVEAAFETREVWRALKRSFLALLMPIIVLVGILAGIFTPTEAAAVAVVYGLIVSGLIYRELGLRDLPAVLVESGIITGIVMFIVATATIFSWLLTSQQVPLKVASFLSHLSSQPWFFLLLVNVTYLLIGCVFEVTAALIMTVPILMPIAHIYGIDSVHLGVVITANMGIGLVTPPVGMCLYVACGISGASVESTVRPLLPFLITMIATLFAITYLPQFTLFLPRLLLGYAG